MALFKKFGQSDAARSEGGSARPRRKKQAEEPQETLEVIRRRARNRLLGAALLVGVTVIGLPMLFDRQPRIVNVDAQVSIPDKGDVAPLQVPARESLDEREEFVPSAEAPAPVATPLPDAPPQAAAPEPAPQPAKAAADAREKERREQQAKAEREQREKQARAEKERQQQQAKAKAERERREQQAKAEKERKEQQAKAEKERQQQQAKAKAEQERKEQQAKAEKERKEQQAKAEKERKELQAKADKERKEQQAKAEKERKDKEAARARALLEGKGAQQQSQRFVIQLGAFTDAQSVRQTRQKAERAGVKTYTQIIKNSAGEERTRVRAGPFTSRQDADKAAATLKGLGLPSAVQAL